MLRKVIVPAVCALLLICHAGAAQTREAEWVASPALTEALHALGLTPEQFRVDAAQMSLYGGGEHVLPLFSAWHANPLRIPYWERHIRTSMLNSAAGSRAACELIAQTSGLLARGIRRDLIPPTPLERSLKRIGKAPTPLRDAILALDPKAKVDEAALKSVPADVRLVAALALRAADDSRHWLAMARRNVAVPEAQLVAALKDLYVVKSWKNEEEEEAARKPADRWAEQRAYYDLMDRLGKIDYSLLYVGAHDIAEALDYASAQLAGRKPKPGERFAFGCSTAMGDIVVSSGTDDVYAAGPHYLLILDLTGNDTYRAGGASGGPGRPVGMILDAAGDDHYVEESERPSFGAGVLGFGFVYDLKGNDTYSAGCGSQGIGVAGVGVLRDFAGNDRYKAKGFCQGAGAFGLGLLIDHAGDDTYDCYIEGQGYGFTLGFGLLLDAAGNDKYTANDTDLIFPSPQSKQHNVSLAQGAGSGSRRDYIDGKSLAGGVGMLLDGAGNDSYFGGLFCQAAGYWYGIGILDDRAGNDTYRGVWYTQSATAHFAVSLLVDGGGDDQYKVTNCVSNGAAHDFSVSLFIEEGGNDVYAVPGIVVGSALTNSVALFCEMAGDDVYRCGYGGGLGLAQNRGTTGWRSGTRTLAVFLDLAGKDTYPGGCPGNGKSWVRQKAFPAEAGVGLDFEPAPAAPKK